MPSSADGGHHHPIQGSSVSSSVSSLLSSSVTTATAATLSNICCGTGQLFLSFEVAGFVVCFLLLLPNHKLWSHVLIEFNIFGLEISLANQ
jgi:hypothetical protein